MTDQQYLRKCSLVVSNSNTALDLSEFRIKFRTSQSDLQSPNNIVCTIYNLSNDESQKIQKEFTRITLQAGYQNGPYGLIFDGTVRRVFRGTKKAGGDNMVPSVRIGRESPTETFLEINAGEGDNPYNFATINETLAAGYDDNDVVKTLNGSLGTNLAPLPYQFGGNPSPRGKVMFGMSRDHLRTLTIPNGMRWSVQNGQLVLISDTAYLPGQVVKLNAQTGLLDLPQQTEDGIIVKCLLNPKIQIGTTIQLNNKDIVPSTFSPEYNAFNFPPPLNETDGTYRVLVSEYEGDTRGEPWWTHLTCISVDPSSPIQSSVKAAG